MKLNHSFKDYNGFIIAISQAMFSNLFFFYKKKLL